LESRLYGGFAAGGSWLKEERPLEGGTPDVPAQSSVGRSAAISIPLNAVIAQGVEVGVHRGMFMTTAPALPSVHSFSRRMSSMR